MIEGRTRGVLAMSAAMTISGTIGLLVVLSRQPLANVVFWRCVFGTPTLLAICGALGVLRPGVITVRQAALAALGGVALVANWLFLFAAYPLASIAVATAVSNTQPFMLVALGFVVLGERPPIVKLAWLVLAFGGMLALVEARPASDHAAGGYVLGIVFALASAGLYALAAIIAKALTGVPPQLIALIQVTVGVVMLAPAADFTNLPATPDNWLCLIAIGVIHTGVMYILLYGAIQSLPTSLTGALAFIYQVVAILVDVLVFERRLAVTQWLGILAILIAAAGSTLGWRIGQSRGVGRPA